MKYTIEFKSGSVAIYDDDVWKSSDKALLKQLESIEHEDLPYTGYEPDLSRKMAEFVAQMFAGEIVSEEETDYDRETDLLIEEAAARGEEIVF